MNRIGQHLMWLAVAVLGAFAFATVALSRGEAVSALWIVVAAICIYLIAYRYYSRFIADKVMQLDPKRMTPAWRHNDGLDYVPTNKAVLFGHHFAAIAGAGPLVGPVLAAQMGYRVHVVRSDEAWAGVTFLTGRRRPKLTLIHNPPEAQAAG